jgi:hypothetical protein
MDVWNLSTACTELLAACASRPTRCRGSRPVLAGPVGSTRTRPTRPSRSPSTWIEPGSAPPYANECSPPPDRSSPRRQLHLAHSSATGQPRGQPHWSASTRRRNLLRRHVGQHVHRPRPSASGWQANDTSRPASSREGLRRPMISPFQNQELVNRSSCGCMMRPRRVNELHTLRRACTVTCIGS